MAIKAANDKSMSNITALPSGVSAKSIILLSTQTASSSAAISFTSNIDSTYKEYVFKFIDIHPATNDANFSFNMSADSGSNYNVTKTTTFFKANHDEAGSSTDLSYYTSGDIAQGTGFQNISMGVGSDNDQCTVGYLHLFDPSSTTFVKHFITRTHTTESSDIAWSGFTAGYGNTTSAVDAVQFKFSSGNVDAGTIKMYGVV